MPIASATPTRHVVLLQALRAAPQRAAELAAGLPPAGQAWRPAPEAWNCRETIAHLAAAEPHFLRRFQTILAADNPWLERFGPETARPDSDQPLERLLAEFAAGRQRLMRLLLGLSPEAWDRPAVHASLGPSTFAAQVQNLCHHDAEHLSQLEALGQRWAAPDRLPEEEAV